MTKFSKLFRNRNFKRLPILFTICCLLFTIFGYFFVVRPGLKVYMTVKEAKPHVRALKDSLLLQDLLLTKEALRTLHEDVEKVEKELEPLSWVGRIPFFKYYYQDARHLLDAADYSLQSGWVVVESIEPFADVLGFKTEGTEASLDAEKKIEGLVKVMPQTGPLIDNISASLDLVYSELGKIDPNRYPESFRGQKIRPLLAQAQKSIIQAKEALPDVRELMTVLPQALGDPTPKTYLILFQNDKELRPTGGFLTAYALMTIKGGKMVDVKSDDIYKLDEKIAEKIPPTPVLVRYLKVEESFIRDSNLSPDFYESCKKFEQFLAKASGFPRIDGIVGIDTYLVRDVLEVLGPVELTGYEEPFSSENVVYQLELYANLLGQYIVGRKDLLGVLMEAMMDKAFHAPRDRWKPLFTTGLKLLSEKHVLLYLHDQRAQALAEEYNFAGRIRDFAGDFLQANEANFAGAKANLYVTRKVRQLVSHSSSCHSEFISESDEKILKRVQDDTSCWIKEVTIDFENPEPYDGWLNGPYRSYIRLLAPEGSKLISVEGGKEAVPQESYFDEALGKQIFAAFNITNPQNTSQLIFKYELPSSVARDGRYRLLIQKQPGHDAPEYEVRVGKHTEEFKLNKDKEVEIGL